MPKSRLTQDASPPSFVMWNAVPQGAELGWQRQWFGHELDPGVVLNIRGIGIREPMFNPDVHRPMGTGDWLIMLFHAPARLDPGRREPSVPANTLVLWPPGARQFYSWGKTSETEPHSWMHVEGTWVEQQVAANLLPVNRPVQLVDASVMDAGLDQLLVEMRRGASVDAIILQNIFQNWARSIARDLQTTDTIKPIAPALLNVQRHLDEYYNLNHSLDDLAERAGMSRSHLCHRFREAFDSTIRGYVIRKRMSVAQRLLYDVNLRIGEIAEAVGYPDIYQFSKQFKKSFGLSPTQYRKGQQP